MIDAVFRSKVSVIILFLVAFAVRLYGFSNPIADWHSWRQADTSSVSRNMLINNFDLLHPTYHDLSNVPSGKDNPEGYRFVEFPFYNVAQAGLFKVIGILTLEEWGRLVTIISSLLTMLFLYLIVRKYAGKISAFWTSFFYAFLPFSIYYSRVILPDPHMVMASMGGIYFFDKWLDDVKSREQRAESNVYSKKNLYFLLSLLFTACALLLKPFAIFFTLPMLYLAYEKFGWGLLKRWHLYVFAILSILPLLLWRQWITQFPEGIPVSDWLFNGGNIRFKGSFFYWLFADRLGRLILGYWGMVLFGLGILANSRTSHLKKHGFFLYSFLLSSVLYMTVIARGNVQHDYYQILIIPSIAIFLGLGANALLHPPIDYINRTISYMLFAICLFFTLLFGWYFVRDFYNINNPKMLIAGKIVDEMTPENAKVIALYDGDTSFLYQTKRSGWTSYQDPLPVLIQKGADYLVMLDPKDGDITSLGEQYEIAYNQNGILLVKLK